MKSANPWIIVIVLIALGVVYFKWKEADLNTARETARQKIGEASLYSGNAGVAEAVLTVQDALDDESSSADRIRGATATLDQCIQNARYPSGTEPTPVPVPSPSGDPVSVSGP